jgi:hypothetical protein
MLETLLLSHACNGATEVTWLRREVDAE